MASAAPSPAVIEIPLERLVPSPFNARKHFDRKELAELSQSIKAEGVLQPLLVRHMGQAGEDARYEIIAGERRYRAAELAELAGVPCLVRQVDEIEARRMQILENLQRADISALEEAEAFQALLKAEGHDAARLVNVLADEKQARPSVEGLAKELGKSKEYVYGRLKLLKLGPAARESLKLGRITPGHAVELVPLDEAKQEKALDWLEETGDEAGVTSASVMDLRDEIRYAINLPPKPKKSAAEAAEDKKFRERQEKEKKQHEAQQAARNRQAEIEKLVDARSLALLWPKLKAADAKTRERLIDTAIASAIHDDALYKAQQIAAGKPLPEQWGRPDVKAFHRAPRAERLALMALSIAIGNLGWRRKENEPTWKWAGIDRKKIAAALAAEQKAAAKAETAPVQTSAKPGKAAKVRKPKAAKHRKK